MCCRHDFSTKELINVYSGQSKLCYNGICVYGPSDGMVTLACSTSLIAIPSILYIAFPGMALMAITPAFAVVGAILMAMSLSMLFMAASTDPGILPRAIKSESRHNFYFPILHNFEIDGVTHKLKYCGTCHIYRSLRASHCSDCDNCVLDFDHHCPWVGTCIARRNYKWFVLFINSSTLLCLYVFITSILQIIYANVRVVMPNEGQNVMEDFKAQPVSFILAVYTFIIAWSIGSLSVFHCVLLCQGKTTREFIKKQSDEEATSMVKRWTEVFCTPTPSYIESLRRGCTADGSDLEGGAAYEQFRPFVVLSCNSREVMDQLSQDQLTTNQHMDRLLEAQTTRTVSPDTSHDEMHDPDVHDITPLANGPTVVAAGQGLPPPGGHDHRATATEVPDLMAGDGPGADGDPGHGPLESRDALSPAHDDTTGGGWMVAAESPNRYMAQDEAGVERRGLHNVVLVPMEPRGTRTS